eukprot:gene17868-19649_t
MSDITVAAIKKLKVVELKAELSRRGLSTKGKKDDLASRLLEVINIREDADENADEVKLSESMEEHLSGADESSDCRVQGEQEQLETRHTITEKALQLEGEACVVTDNNQQVVDTNSSCEIPEENDPNCGKVDEEHIISSHVMDHFTKYNILSDAQHGFRPKRSCESQLIITIHEIAQALDQGEQTDIILLDFQKAFDKVPHKRLLAKLDHYGIRGNLNAWVCSFLSNRSQRVIIGGKKI